MQVKPLQLYVKLATGGASDGVPPVVAATYRSRFGDPEPALDTLPVVAEPVSAEATSPGDADGLDSG